MDKYIPLSKAYHNLYKLEEVRDAEWGAKRFTTEDIENLFEESVEEDIAPIKHGKWISVDDGDVGDTKCSLCGCYHHTWEAYGYYCQHCGAKMDGGLNE